MLSRAKYDRKSDAIKSKTSSATTGGPTYSANLCDSHKTYLCPPTHRRTGPPAAENCRCCRVPGRPNHSQLDQAQKEPAGSITAQPYAAVAAVDRGKAARSQRDVAVPDAARRLRPRNSTPYDRDWAQRRLMRFLFCRRLNLQPQIQVFREPWAACRSRLKRTATYCTRWHGAWPTAAVEHVARRLGRFRLLSSSVFFWWSRPPARHRAKDGDVTPAHRLHVAMRRRGLL
jgi:hypothetical protein